MLVKFIYLKNIKILILNKMNKVVIESLKKICYGFGFGLGMGASFKILPVNRNKELENKKDPFLNKELENKNKSNYKSNSS